MGVKGEGFLGTSIKDTWTKPRRGEIRDGKSGGPVGGKWRQLYLNNN